MLYKIILLILVTFIPAFELRASIPLGILKGSINLPFGLVLEGFGMNWLLVFFICVFANAVLGTLLYLIINKFIHLFIKFRFFNYFYHKNIERAQKKIKPLVDKYGLFGIAFFIAVPLPGSGSYSGALIAYILGLDYKRFIVANLIGVILAGIIVSLATLGIINILF